MKLKPWREPLHVEYVSKENSVDVQWARLLFILEAQAVCPAFLCTLRKRVFPLYGKIPKNERGQIKSALDRLRLDEEITKWAAAFNANKKWITEQARDTLRLWETPQHRKALTWVSGVTLPSGATAEEDFRFGFRRLYSGFETARDYKRELLHAAGVEADEYIANVREGAEKAKLKRGRRSYSRKHFTWLAQHEIAGLSYAQIERLQGRTRFVARPADEVRKGVQAAAKLLGWGSLRKSGK